MHFEGFWQRGERSCAHERVGFAEKFTRTGQVKLSTPKSMLTTLHYLGYGRRNMTNSEIWGRTFFYEDQ